MSDLIELIPDAKVEPGHQVLAIDFERGFYLAALLVEPLPPESWSYSEDGNRMIVLVPHTDAVDQKIMDLINELAHVRYSAPNLVQMTLSEAMDDGMEGA